MANEIQMNPFIINGIIPDELFCDRLKETEKITRALQNNTNVLLTSHRRMGKTQLIRHIFSQKTIRDNYYAFYTDIYATTSLSEFVMYLSKEIYSQLVPKGKRIYDGFISTLKSLSGSFTYDPVQGVPVFDVRLGSITSPELTLEEIFAYLESADRRCIFAIDEFQKIGDYPEKNVEALLRTHIQKLCNCNFIFAGSDRHILENMFNSSAKPFYNSASEMYLDRIERKTYVGFICNCFETNGRHIDEDAAYYSYDLFEGHTYFVHSLLHDVYASVDPSETVTCEDVLKSLDSVLEDKSHSFTDQMSMLNFQQKEVLVAIAKDGKAEAVTSVAFIRKHSLTSPSSVQNALRTLVERGFVTYESSGRSKIYSLSDRYLELWVKKIY